MASDQHINLNFESKALSSDTFKVVRFEGEEAISQPYRFEIELISDQPDIDLDAVLGQAATLSFQRGDDGDARKIHGVLSEFEQGQEGQYGHYQYRAVLVPRIWMLSLSRQNQIYQNKSAVEIVEEELKGAKDKGPAELSAIGLTSEDFEFRLSGDYAKREYVVQYQETDLDFVSRLMEHEGVFYFFEHNDEREKIVFCDDNVHLPALNGDSKISYTPSSALSSTNEESVQVFRQVRRQITGKMILKDYNYRTPTTPLQGEADIDDKGHGLVSEYGNHFKTPEEGQALAKIRAQEILCRKKQFFGESDSQNCAAGNPFTLEGHYNGAFDDDYVPTRVRHSGAQAFAEATGFPEVDGQATSYRNEFTAIPLAVLYRPARLTPRPKLHGVMNAQIDASGAGTRAEIDAEGRYKLVMPFDLSGQAKGKATRWVRMAQPYGGSQHGMHFPLHKGTEVIWTCVDGDPDRPIITGVAPNPLNRSVVSGESHTKNRIQTASGILIEFEDGPGAKGDEPQSGDQQQMQRLAPASITKIPGQTEARDISFGTVAANTTIAAPLVAQQQHTAYVGANRGGQDDPATAANEQGQGRYLRMHVPQATLDSSKNNPPQTIDPQDPHYQYYGAQPDAHPGNQGLPNDKIEAYMRMGANIPRTDGSALKSGEDAAWLPLRAEPGDDLFGLPALEKTTTDNQTGETTTVQTQTRAEGLFDGFIDNVSDGNDENSGNPSRTDEASKAKFRNGVVWRDHVSGNRLSTTLGDSVEIITGNYRQVICNGSISMDAVNGVLRNGSNVPGNVSMKWVETGTACGLTGDSRDAAADADSPKQWGTTEVTRNGWTKADYEGYTENRTKGDTYSTYKGYQESHTLGNKLDTYLGIRTEIAGGMDLSYWAGFTGSVHQGMVVEIDSDWKYHWNQAGEFVHVEGNTYSVSEEQDLIAAESIMLQVNKPAVGAAKNWFRGLTRGGQFLKALPLLGFGVPTVLRSQVEKATDTGTQLGLPTVELKKDRIDLRIGMMPGGAAITLKSDGTVSIDAVKIELNGNMISLKGGQIKLN